MSDHKPKYVHLCAPFLSPLALLNSERKYSLKLAFCTAQLFNYVPARLRPSSSTFPPSSTTNVTPYSYAQIIFLSQPCSDESRISCILGPMLKTLPPLTMPPLLTNLGTLLDYLTTTTKMSNRTVLPRIAHITHNLPLSSPTLHPAQAAVVPHHTPPLQHSIVSDDTSPPVIMADYSL